MATFFSIKYFRIRSASAQFFSARAVLRSAINFSIVALSNPFDMVDVKIIARQVDYETTGWDYEMDDDCKTLYIFKDM
jgi:hypothetical protein